MAIAALGDGRGLTPILEQEYFFFANPLLQGDLSC
jgi:hypothetical protein